MDNENVILTYDVSAEAWKTYKILYKNNMKSCDFDKDIIKDEKRRYIDNTFEYSGKVSEKIKFSGELDFNISKKNIFGLGQSRYIQFKKFLKTSKRENVKTYVDILDNLCDEDCYLEYNISLMPQTGSLQLVKKSIGNDRLDVFIWFLNEYYSESNNFLFNFCSFENTRYLKSYLDIFSNVDEYCEAVYHINRSLTKKLVTSGSKALNSPERIMEYLDLALEFYEQKKRYIESYK